MPRRIFAVFSVRIAQTMGIIPSLLGWVLAQYSFQNSARLSPFQAVYGRPPQKLHQYLPGEFKVDDRNELLRQLHYNLEWAQHRMTKVANAKRRDLQFEKGVKVLLKLQPHCQSSVQHCIHQKVAPWTVVLWAIYYCEQVKCGCIQSGTTNFN